MTCGAGNCGQHTDAEIDWSDESVALTWIVVARVGHLVGASLARLLFQSDFAGLSDDFRPRVKLRDRISAARRLRTLLVLIG